MFYKIAKTLSKVTIVFGFMCMVGGCSVEQQEAQEVYERTHTREEWMKNAGKNYL